MSNFCTNCGFNLVSGQIFCTGCGAKITNTAPSSIPPQSKKSSTKKILTSILLFFVSIILIFLGFRSMNLSVSGVDAVATIINTTQATDRYDDGPSDPRRYRVTYEFSVSGVRYTGSTTQIFPQGITQNTTIPVKYIENSPQKHAASADAKVSGGLIMIGLGIILIFPMIIVPLKKSR